jgi:hypothetical protein
MAAESNRQLAKWTERSEPNPKRRTESWKDATISWQGYGISILGCACYYIHRLPRKMPDHQQQVLHSGIGAFKR